MIDKARPSELDIVYNPSLGAYLIWRTCAGFFGEAGLGMPVPFAFLALPLALHFQTRRIAASTNKASGLSLFAAKLGMHQEDLLAVHERALALRELTLASIAVATASELIAINSESALLLPFEARLPKQPEVVVKTGVVCEKFGVWFARIPAEQVASILRMSF